MAKSVRLVGPSQRAFAHRLIDEAPDGYVMKLGEETRNDQQNRAMHGWIKVIRQHDPDMRVFTPDQCKLRFLDALGEEMAYLPKLENSGFFPVGLRSSTLTKAQFAALLTIIDGYAAARGIDLPRSPEFWGDDSA